MHRTTQIGAPHTTRAAPADVSDCCAPVGRLVGSVIERNRHDARVRFLRCQLPGACREHAEMGLEATGVVEHRRTLDSPLVFRCLHVGEEKTKGRRSHREGAKAKARPRSLPLLRRYLLDQRPPTPSTGREGISATEPPAESRRALPRFLRSAPSACARGLAPLRRRHRQIEVRNTQR